MKTCYIIYLRLSKLSELQWSIHEFHGDEIQDFTQAELVLLMKCINDPNAMFLTGDTAQSIMKGVAFCFSDLRSLFHYASKNSVDKKQRKPKRIYQLYQNYKSHSSRVKKFMISACAFQMSQIIEVFYWLIQSIFKRALLLDQLFVT